MRWTIRRRYDAKCITSFWFFDVFSCFLTARKSRILRIAHAYAIGSHYYIYMCEFAFGTLGKCVIAIGLQLMRNLKWLKWITFMTNLRLRLLSGASGFEKNYFNPTKWSDVWILIINQINHSFNSQPSRFIIIWVEQMCAIFITIWL